MNGSIFDSCDDFDHCPVHFRNDTDVQETVPGTDVDVHHAITYVGEHAVYTADTLDGRRIDFIQKMRFFAKLFPENFLREAASDAVKEMGHASTESFLAHDYEVRVIRVGHGSLSDVEDEMILFTRYSNIVPDVEEARKLHGELAQSVKDGTFNGDNL